MRNLREEHEIKQNWRGDISKPVVSICCITYNHEKFIEDAMEGFLIQETDFPFEILINDDASTDQTAAIICEYEQKYPNLVKSIYQKENQFSKGQKPLIDFVLPRAAGKYVALCEGDDYWTDPCKLQRQVDFLEDHPNYSACFHPVKWLENGILRNAPYKPTIIKDFYTENDVLENILQITVCSTVFLRSSLKDLPEWFSIVPYGDNVIHLLNARNGRIGYINEVMATYRRHEKGLYGGESEFNRAVKTIQAFSIIGKNFQYQDNIFLKKRLLDLYLKLGKISFSTAKHIQQELTIWSKKEEREVSYRAVPSFSGDSNLNMLAIENQKKGETKYEQDEAINAFKNAIKLFYQKGFVDAENEIDKYRKKIDYNLFSQFDNRKANNPKVSVVIVAFNTNHLLLECINTLSRQSFRDFEIILVDNGGNEGVQSKLRKLSIQYIKCPINFVLSEGRNIGARFAKGDIIAFLDDDAIVPYTYIESIIEAFNVYDIVGFRGKVLPKSDNKNNELASHYDLGDIPIPATIDAEGNSAFSRKAFIEMNGMNPLLFGMEGFELSYRIAKKFDCFSTIYWPKTVIFHDYAASDKKLEEKTQRHNLMREYCVKKLPDIYIYHAQLTKYSIDDEFRKTGLALIPRNNAKKKLDMPNAATKMRAQHFPFSDVKISVCIPTYNREVFVQRAIKSALNQKCDNYEIVVVDDGSTDGTVEVIKSFNSDKIRLITKIHSGAPESRNRAVQEANGEYIVWLDSDDEFAEDIIKEYIFYIDRYHDFDVLYCDNIRIHEEVNKSQEIRYSSYIGRVPMGKFLGGPPIPNVGAMIKKDLFEKTGLYNRQFTRAHDYEFWVRAQPYARFRHCPKMLYLHHFHNQGNLSPIYYDNVDTSYEIRVTDYIINNYSLESLFPEVDWQNLDIKHKNNLMAKVYYSYAQIYKRWKDLNRARDYALKSIEKEKTKETNDFLKNIYYLMQSSKSGNLNRNKNKVDEPQFRQKSKEGGFPIIAIIAAFNESDIIYHVIRDLVKQGIQVYLIDHHSTDNTVVEATKWLGKGLIKLETFPDDSGFDLPKDLYAWRYILRRKEQIVKDLGVGWYIHADADEFREAPWINLNLREGIEKVDKEGYNAINFKVFDFKPTDNAFTPGSDVREALKFYSLPTLNYDNVQIKCWKYFGQSFDLWKSGGHIVRFNNQKIYPIPFILRHYPIRSQKQGEKKVFKERKNRFDKHEKQAKWHAQYDHVEGSHTFLHNKLYLELYNREKVCNEILSEFEKEQFMENILVSIIILTYNQLEYTKRCLESIAANTPEPHEIIIVDNGSTDGTVEWLRNLAAENSDYRLIENEENLGFALGNNKGIVEAKGDYIVLMNNDVVVTPGWLKRLVGVAQKKPQIGIVGPMSNYVSGPQLVKEVSYVKTSLKGLKTFSQAFARKHAGQTMPYWRVVGFCMLIKREVIDKIGGLDGRFGLGNFEDDDFSLRAALAGFESWIVKDCFIHHFGSRTFAGAKIDFRESLHKNWEIFKEKWGIPGDVAYGASYDMRAVVRNGFIPEKHYCPLSDKEYGSPYSNKEQEDTDAAKKMYQNAQMLVEKGMDNAAIMALGKLLESYPDFALAHNDLGVLYYKAGKKEDAFEHYKKAAELQPENINFQKNLADFYYVELGKVQEAIEIYVKILALNPQDIECLLMLGHISVSIEKIDDAKVFYSKVLEVDPGNVDAKQNLDSIQNYEQGTAV